ncbi:polyphosphate kinase 1 [Allobaculum stercoricanis]|uniref:polyphosphate kinase 1 n=1 Tax=Allobaculum stercoricanis TaxID=174709 RepID=UPI0023F21C00|nr:polyphosphate kinase 1 [Allobaculum stercoricanis]
MSKNTQKYRYTQNRELSWLRFNQRVLEEAADQDVPALERLKFISIFSSNLDEFFMVRVGSLFDLAHMTPDDTDSKTGWTPSNQLRHIYHTIPGLLTMKKQIYTAVMETLGQNGIQDVSIETLNSDDLKQVNRFFKKELLPILSPILIGPNHPVPHLVNKRMNAVAMLKNKKGERAVGIVPVPAHVSPYLLLEDGMRYVRTENILLHWLPALFDAYTVKESCILTVTRNADISFDDEKFEDNEDDFRRQMKKLLKQRDHLSVVRLELSTQVSSEFQKLLSGIARVEKYQIFVDSTPLNMGYVFKLVGDLPKELSTRLLYPTYRPRWAEDLKHDQPIMPQIQKKDRLLFYPFDSVDPFLRLLNEAADNPHVLSIKITIYRLASSSKIAQTLCRAAENGKEVLVLMELRARFDEENNLLWSKMLEESGCQVIYGTEGYKCHSKICLITLRNHNKTTYLTQIGTGNYNEKTNAMYTDLSLMTTDQTIGEDAAAFFRNMLVNKLDGEYQKLCVSPFGIKEMLLKNIDRQIALGKEGYICIKTNSVTERNIIDKLAQASQAGVEVQLIVRGICCILPGVVGETERIHVTSIVGRFLEHSRIYQFGRGEQAEYYISSADLMTRNLNHRVEIACPVQDAQIKEQLKWILDAQLHDTAKASLILPDGTYCRKHSAVPFDSQNYFMEQSPHIPVEPSQKPEKLSQRIKQWFSDVFNG